MRYAILSHKQECCFPEYRRDCKCCIDFIQQFNKQVHIESDTLQKKYDLFLFLFLQQK